MKPNIRIAPGQPTTVDIHVIHLPRGVKTPLSHQAVEKFAGAVVRGFREAAAMASLLLADWSRNTATIAEAIEAVLRDNPNANLLENRASVSG